MRFQPRWNLKAVLLACLLILLCFGFSLADEPNDVGMSADGYDSGFREGKPELISKPERGPLPKGVFSFLWLGDTQLVPYYIGKYQILSDSVLGALEDRNVVCMLGTGDYVDAFPSVYQWSEFSAFIDPIRAHIPVIGISGNHDMNERMLNYEPFRTGFYGEGKADVLENCFNRGQGIYSTFSAGNVEWLVVGMSYRYRNVECQWMNEVLEKYPDRKAILLLHDYMRADGTMRQWGQKMLDNVILPHENVRLVLCGHYDGTYIREDMHPAGHTVKTVIWNQQEDYRYFGEIKYLAVDTEKEEIVIRSETPLKPKTDSCETTFPIDLS